MIRRNKFRSRSENNRGSFLLLCPIDFSERPPLETSRTRRNLFFEFKRGIYPRPKQAAAAGILPAAVFYRVALRLETNLLTKFCFLRMSGPARSFPPWKRHFSRRTCFLQGHNT